MSKRKLTATEFAARQFRWGQLIAGIESARAGLAVAARAGDLLQPDDQTRMSEAAEILSSMEQLAWRISDSERKAQNR